MLAILAIRLWDSKKPVGRLCLGPVIAGTGNTLCGFLPQTLGKTRRSRIQALIAKRQAEDFLAAKILTARQRQIVVVVIMNKFDQH
jgi:hypothetical protein